MNAFLTGSLAYAQNRFRNVTTDEKGVSDIDLVVLVSPVDGDLLQEYFKEGVCHPNSYPGSFSVKVGRLNLIVCTEESTFSYWKLGTELLIHKLRGRSREVAVAVFTEIKERFSAYFVTQESLAEIQHKAAEGKRE